MEHISADEGLRFRSAALRVLARRLTPCAPFALAALQLLLGYRHYAPGAAHPQDYHHYSFEALNYSDIVWLYLRDDTAGHRRPYLDYALEYPPLIGGLIYLLGFAPDLRAYFRLSYAVMAAGALATIAALRRLPGVNSWYFAAAPALFLYAGLNWDLPAIALTALALLAYSRGHDRWGTLALVGAIWCKLFPLAFVPAILVERLRARRLRAVLEIGGLLALGSAAINLPLARANYEHWRYFYTFNRDRAHTAGIWVLLPQLTVPEVNRLILLALLIAGAGYVTMGFFSRRPVLLPLGAVLLLLWLALNKVYSPQYALWVFLGLALLRPNWSLWTAFMASDIGHFAVSFLILYSVRFQAEGLVDWQLEHLRTPLELLRVGLLATFIALGVASLIGQGRAEQATPVQR